MVFMFLKRCQHSRGADLAKLAMLARFPKNVVDGPFQGDQTKALRDLPAPALGISPAIRTARRLRKTCCPLARALYEDGQCLPFRRAGRDPGDEHCQSCCDSIAALSRDLSGLVAHTEGPPSG